mmetsp:Transcript_13555/g.25561  ORF Transcript_13555/g.25561 Transcript_13555/m.25561 type:complete len:457 (+) Transcript_13555:141-1511(+)
MDFIPTCFSCSSTSFTMCKLCTSSACLQHMSKWSAQLDCKHIAIFVSQLTEAELVESRRLLESKALKDLLGSKVSEWVERQNQEIESHIGPFAELVADLTEEYKTLKETELKSTLDKLAVKDIKGGIEQIEQCLPSTKYKDFESYLCKNLGSKIDSASQTGSTLSSPCLSDCGGDSRCYLQSKFRVHGYEVYGILRDEYDLLNLSWDTAGLCYRWQTKNLAGASKTTFENVSSCAWNEDNSKVFIGQQQGDILMVDRAGKPNVIGTHLRGGITRLAHLSRSNHLLSLNHGQRIAVWCLDRCKFIYLHSEYSVTDFQITNGYLAFAFKRKAIVKDLISNEVIFSFDCPTNASILSLSDDETQMIVGCKSGYLKQFDLRNGLPLLEIAPTERTAVQIKPTYSYKSIACLFSDLTCRVLDTTDLQPISYWRPEFDASAVEWVGGSLVTGTKNGYIRISN